MALTYGALFTGKNDLALDHRNSSCKFLDMTFFAAATTIISLEACQFSCLTNILLQYRANTVILMFKHLKNPLEQENEPSSLQHFTAGGAGLYMDISKPTSGGKWIYITQEIHFKANSTLSFQCFVVTVQ